MPNWRLFWAIWTILINTKGGFDFELLCYFEFEAIEPVAIIMRTITLIDAAS